MRAVGTALALITATLLVSIVPAAAAEPLAVVNPTAPGVLDKANLQYYWRLPLQLSPGETLQQVYLLDENLYCATSQGRVIAVDAASGLVKWSHEVTQPGGSIFKPVHVDGLALSEKPVSAADIASAKPQELVTFNAVLINSLNHVIVLNRDNGKLYRDIPFSFAANTGGAADKNYFYVGSTRGCCYAIRLMEAVSLWAVPTDDLITAPVVVFNRHVYVGSQDRTFRSLAVGHRPNQEWQRELGGPVTAGFVVDSRGCFVPCEDNRLYAFDPESGKPLWGGEPFICQAPLRDPPVATENSILQYARQDAFYAIDVATGRLRWKMQRGQQVLAAMEGDLFIRDVENQLNIVNEMTGQVSLRVPLSGYDLFVTNTKAPAIYTASFGGQLFCIRKSSAGYLTPQMLRPASQPATAPVAKVPAAATAAAPASLEAPASPAAE